MKRLVVVWLVVAIFGGPVAWGLSDVLGVEAVAVRIAIGAVLGGVSALALYELAGSSAAAAGRRRAIGDRLGDLALRVPFVARRARARWAPKLFYGDTVIGHISHAHFAPVLRSASFDFDLTTAGGKAAAEAEAEHEAMVRRSIRGAPAPAGETTDAALARLTPRELAVMDVALVSGTLIDDVVGSALVARGLVSFNGDHSVAGLTEAGLAARRDALAAGVVPDHTPPLWRMADAARALGLRPTSGVDPAAGPVAPADESTGGNASAEGSEGASGAERTPDVLTWIKLRHLAWAQGKGDTTISGFGEWIDREWTASPPAVPLGWLTDSVLDDVVTTAIEFSGGGPGHTVEAERRLSVRIVLEEAAWS